MESKDENAERLYESGISKGVERNEAEENRAAVVAQCGRAGDDDIIVTYRDGTQFCLKTVERGRVEKVLAELVENLNEEEDG